MYLGLDLGTTNVKAVVLSDDGGIAARGAVPVETYAGPGGPVDQDLNMIREATVSAISKAAARVERTKIQVWVAKTPSCLPHKGL